jgi:hypothetical protein
MKNRIVLMWFSISMILIICNSCKQTTSPSETPVSAPSRDLPAREIMKIQGITSIHYVEYDSIVVNGTPYRGFLASHETYFDSSRMKQIQYILGTPNMNITVYDLNKDSAWNHYSGQLTYPQLPNLRLAFEENIQSSLGSRLKGPITLMRSEYLGDKLCNVFTDSTGYQEWVWIKHRLPIQHRSEAHYDVYQISVVQKRNIEINYLLPNSIFEPPH